MKQKETWEVEVWDVQVDEFYFSFEYRVSKNGKVVDEQLYENDHAWQDDMEGWKKRLEDGYAIHLALTNVL